MIKSFSVLTLMVALVGAACAQEKPRLFVLTDISNEPDDEESLVRLLVYANEFDVEGLVATTSTWLKTKPREDLIRRDITAYAEVRTNLLRHALGFPPPEQLLAITKTGQTNYGMAFVGTGKSSPGSQFIIDAADKDGSASALDYNLVWSQHTGSSADRRACLAQRRKN